MFNHPRRLAKAGEAADSFFRRKIRSCKKIRHLSLLESQIQSLACTRSQRMPSRWWYPVAVQSRIGLFTRIIKHIPSFVNYPPQLCAILKYTITVTHQSGRFTLKATSNGTDDRIIACRNKTWWNLVCKRLTTVCQDKWRYLNSGTSSRFNHPSLSTKLGICWKLNNFQFGFAWCPYRFSIMHDGLTI